MRFPFASTINNDFLLGCCTTSGTPLFGDIIIAGKSILCQCDTLTVVGELQVALPTAGDLNALTGGPPVAARIFNDTVYLGPYLGALYTPDDRFFTQGFLQFDTPANSNRVAVASNPDGSLANVGHIRDVSFLYADIGMGYWVYRNPDAAELLGVTAIMELHYNRALNSTSSLPVSSEYVIGSVLTDIDMLNTVIGGSLHFRPNLVLSLGYVTPIGNSVDQMFTGEVRAFINYYFGR
ncbi:MAG: hypothetical protein EHM42_07575 [Planctomycetaceae bacterium]|nr:MAG: hypothetical protein EHM42_07575 [Planctomycetaceae bacterium]